MLILEYIFYFFVFIINGENSPYLFLRNESKSTSDMPCGPESMSINIISGLFSRPQLSQNVLDGHGARLRNRGKDIHTAWGRWSPGQVP